MTDEELAHLHASVHRAQTMADRPLEPGEESRPVESFTDHLSDEGWLDGWRLVHELRNRLPELFRLYAEEELHHAALELLRDSERPAAIDEIARQLHSDGVDDGSWLVAVPLANISLDHSWVPLGEGVAIQRAPKDDTPGWRDADEEDLQADMAVRRHLGDRIPPATRTLHLASGSTDTHRSATLYLVEAGPARAAIRTARAKAHYALATWSILARPPAFHVVPDVALWTPQPFLQQGPWYKRYETDRWHAQVRTSSEASRRWSPYPLPTDETVLTAPFRAFAVLDRRPAQALLSGTIRLHTAGRAARAQLSDQLRDVRAAIDSLCERSPGASGANKRWERLATRLDVWDRVVQNRSYTPETIEQLQKRTRDARNISAHGADAALIDLGWGIEDRPLSWGAPAGATDLSVGALQRDLEPMRFAVGEALRATWPLMLEANFNVEQFEKLFT